MKVEIRDNYTLKAEIKDVPKVTTMGELHDYLERVEKVAQSRGYDTTWIGRFHLIVYKGRKAYSIQREGE